MTTHQHTHDDKMVAWTRGAALVGILLGVLALLAIATMAPGGGGVVLAQENNSSLNDTAPYYNNSTSIGNQSEWYPDGENVTLDTLGEMATRLGPYIIGTGEQIPGGATYAGTIITGLAVTAVFLGAVAFTSLGAAGGVVVAATVAYGMTTIGLAPPWLKVVLLMIIGVIAAVAALRVTK